jgi:arylsulfatase A-like enzyme
MRSTRRAFLGAAAVAPAVLAQRSKRPNVLFLLADEWRAQATPFEGDPNVRTPVLQRLAAESVRFDTTVSSLPVCCPYRGSLITGQFPLTHGVFINDVPLRPKGVTMGEAFTRAGYRTGYIGKWHLYGSPGGANERRLDYIPPEKRFGFDYWKACECTHDYNRSLYYDGDDRTPKYWPGYDAFAQTDDASAFIERQAKTSDPFCLVLSYGPPHFPLNTAPERYRAMFQEGEIALRENVPAESRAAAVQGLRGYYAHMAALDECFGRLLATLERARIAEDTIVVFTSDHGDMMQSQGLTTKLHPWDESVRVPFVLRYPRRFGRKARRVRTPMNSPDIFPTLLGLAGLPIPDSVEGGDHSKLEESDRAALIQLPVPITEARRYGFAEYRGLRSARYTYVRSIRGPWLLYDNQADPFQKHNLIGKDRELEARMERELTAELKRRKDDFLPASTYLERAGLSHYREANVKIGRHPSPWGDWDSTLTS